MGYVSIYDTNYRKAVLFIEVIKYACKKLQYK